VSDTEDLHACEMMARNMRAEIAPADKLRP